MQNKLKVVIQQENKVPPEEKYPKFEATERGT
jgi:hypothetical protein